MDHTAQLELLSTVGEIMIGSDDAAELGVMLSDAVRRAFNADASALRTLDGSRLVIMGASGIPHQEIVPEIDARSGIAAKLVNGRLPISIEDTAKHPATSSLHSAAIGNPNVFVFRSYAGVPMIYKGEVVGVLGIYTKHEKRCFDSDTLEQLQTIANHIAVAVINHRLFEEMKRQNLLLLHQEKQRKEAEQQAEILVAYDSLTGLPKRLLFMEHLQRTLYRASQDSTRKSIVCCIDCDRFSLINEVQGHEAADKLLVDITKRIQKSARADDVIARYGGDSFTILAEGFFSDQEAQDYVDNILDELHHPYRGFGRSLYLTFSAGICTVSSMFKSPAELLHASEMAMREAKALGRNQIKHFNPSRGVADRKLMELEVDLRDAIHNDEIGVCFQPIVDARGGSIYAFEALARWTHPVRGDISPVVFIPIAENGGWIRKLGWRVLKEAIRKSRAHSSRHSDPPVISINLAARQLIDPAFPRRLTTLLKEEEFPASSLCLEITETMIMTRSSVAVKTLNKFRDAGARILIDDFGTGYSSLSYLHSLPVKYETCS